MAFSLSHPCVPFALPAPLPGRLARHQRLRLCAPQPYGLTAAAIREQAVYPLPARPLRGGSPHAVARDQGRQPASRSLIVVGYLVPDKFYKGGSQEKTLLRRLELFLLLSPLDGAGSVLTARTRCSVAGHCGPAI